MSRASPPCFKRNIASWAGRKILMNNAGKGSGGAFLVDTSTGEFDAVVKTDLYGRSLAVGNSSGGVGPRTEVEKSSTSPPFTKR